MSPRKCASRRATCRSRSASARPTVVAIYVLLNALYASTRCRSAELAAVPGARLMDTAAERLFGFAAGNLLALFTIISLSASVPAR